MRSQAHIWWVMGVAAVLVGLARVLPKTAVAENAPEPGEIRLKTVRPDEATRQMLEKLAGYERWAKFSGHPEKPTRPSDAHRGLWAVRYYNPTARAALAARAWRFPAGSALVDEDRTEPTGSPTVVTAMIKQADGEWYWIQYTPDGRVVKDKHTPLAGQVGTCILCHSQSGHDMVYGGPGDS